MPAYYNEIEPFAAAWLRALIKRKMIPEGEVDERSIVDVSPDDLVGFHQCHFFAGIGGWPYALRLAGWDDDREVWSGSAPCQSLSIAGKGEMHTDDWRKLRAGAENPVVDPRHLWPAFYKLIAARKPAAVFGEQVGKRAGLDWLTAVRADLEDFGYAVGGADLPACSVGAPHIRQRIFWVGVACGLGDSTGRRDERQRTDWAFSKHVNAGQAIGLADADRADLRVPRRGSDDGAPAGEQGAERKRERLRDDAGAGGGGAIGLADAERERREGIGLLLRAERGAVPEAAGSGGERAAFTASDGRAGSAHGLGHTSDQGLQTRERTTALG